MDIKDLKLLIKLVTETDITEFEMEGSEEKIRIKRGVTPEVVHYQAPPVVTALPQAVAAPAMAPAAAPGVPAAAAPVVEKGEVVVSPIVGTFYRAPAPDAPPYVEVGQVVEKGQVLCIVEAMKLMNEIEAEIEGTILQILVENGHTVEYGEPLFKIKVG